MNWEYSIEPFEILQFAIQGETYSVDHKMRYSPALAMALRPVYIQKRICKVLRSQTPQCGTPNWHMLMRITAILTIYGKNGSILDGHPITYETNCQTKG